MKAKGKPFPVVITIRLELLSVALFYKIPAFFGLIIPPVKSRIWYCKETITLWGIIFAALSMPSGKASVEKISQSGRKVFSFMMS
jgi:hypothetical protein